MPRLLVGRTALVIGPALREGIVIYAT